MENIFKDIMKSVYAELKPLGYKKDGQNLDFSRRMDCARS